ncbi:MAG: CPBP family intramembrane glutamic endopeptidase [Aeoliella sp.]
MQESRAPRSEIAILAFACILPTLVTLTYFVMAQASESSVQQAIFASTKLVQFGLPVVWVGLLCRERLRWPRPTWSGLALGLVFGLVVAGALWLLYQGLRGTALLDDALAPIRAKITDLAIDSAWRFAAVGVFYSLVHSLLEEYYWRWFVFGRLRHVVALLPAIAISAVAFSAHHVIVLWHYFSHSPIVAILLSACIAVGGAVWAWLYHRSESIYGPWLSHLCVDAAIFGVGYHLAKPLFSS